MGRRGEYLLKSLQAFSPSFFQMDLVAGYADARG